MTDEDKQIEELADSLEAKGSFGIITTFGYKQLKDQFDEHTRKTLLLAKVVVVGMLVQLFVLVYAFYTDYQGRKVVVAAAREGCERDKLDRAASVTLNENILIAFIEGDRKQSGIPTAKRQRALAEIDATTAGLDARAKINCNERYPEVGLLP